MIAKSRLRIDIEASESGISAKPSVPETASTDEDSVLPIEERIKKREARRSSQTANTATPDLGEESTKEEHTEKRPAKRRKLIQLSRLGELDLILYWKTCLVDK